MEFRLHAPYQPTGDQPQAIEALVKGFQEGNQFQTLLGVTGSGKTFTMANIIQQLQKPTLVIAHNKTLAAQLYGEFKEFFPENAVEYFVSYYDYYQPEAYIPSSDTYIAKDSAINDEIDKLRLSATAALTERRDVIVIASVSCIYGLGSPEDYQELIVSLRPGMMKERDQVLRELVDIQYTRNDMDVARGTFRVRGDVIEICPAYTEEYLIRVEFFGDEIDRIAEIDPMLVELEVNPQFLQMISPNETVVVISLNTIIGETTGMINICIPHVVLEPIVPNLSVRYWMQTNTKEISPEQTKMLETRVKQATLPVIAELGTTNITIEDFLMMAMGDVIELDQKFENPLTLKVGNLPKFTVQPGKLNKKMAVQIIDPLKGGDEDE